MSSITDIDKKHYKIKYFYHIDSHAIVTKLKKQLSSTFDTAKTFQTIFNEMIPACKLFSEYILSNDYLPNLSFFNDYYPEDVIRGKASTLFFSAKPAYFITAYYTDLKTNYLLPNLKTIKSM